MSKITKTMSFSKMQESDHVDESQALHDMSICDIMTVFDLADVYIRHKTATITIVNSDITVEIETK